MSQAPIGLRWRWPLISGTFDPVSAARMRCCHRLTGDAFLSEFHASPWLSLSGALSLSQALQQYVAPLIVQCYIPIVASSSLYTTNTIEAPHSASSINYGIIDVYLLQTEYKTCRCIQVGPTPSPFLLTGDTSAFIWCHNCAQCDLYLMESMRGHTSMSIWADMIRECISVSVVFSVFPNQVAIATRIVPKFRRLRTLFTAAMFQCFTNCSLNISKSQILKAVRLRYQCANCAWEISQWPTFAFFIHWAMLWILTNP